MDSDFETQVMEEVERRLSSNLLDWEEHYKENCIHQLREQLAEELRGDFEDSL